MNFCTAETKAGRTDPAFANLLIFALRWRRGFGHVFPGMPFPTQPVTLSVEQLTDLHQKVADMRHDINNHLSLIVAAMELIRHKPDSAQRMVATMAEQPSRIGE